HENVESRLSPCMCDYWLRTDQATPNIARNRILYEQYEQVSRTHEHLCNVCGGRWGPARFRGRRMTKFFRIPTLVSREIASVVLRLLVSEPSRCSGSWVDDDLHVLLVVVDEFVESAGDEFVEADSGGDECRQVDLPSFG